MQEKDRPPKSLSLLWRILLSTSVSITALLGFTGWLVQSYAIRVSQHSLENEIKTSLEAYRALWAERAQNAARLSKVMSAMSDVRAAFMTHDSATIRDAAGQLWAGISATDTSFSVLEPQGEVIAALGGQPVQFEDAGAILRQARTRFPEQLAGYVVAHDRLYYVVLTPVYVQTNNEPALLNVLLVALSINDRLPAAMKGSTNGSDFVFVADHRRVLASSLGMRDFPALPSEGQRLQGDFWRVKLHDADSLLLETRLPSLEGSPPLELFVVRSLSGDSGYRTGLERNAALIAGLAMGLGLLLTYWLAKRILRPIEALDRAAEEVIRLNYDQRVPVETGDELGRLAATFNAMCESIKAARAELITRERIATIGRLAASFVHDMRNPLAAIYGGAEMMVDSELSNEQQKRLAGNIYRSSRQIQGLLDQLLEASSANSKVREDCRVADLLHSACDSIEGAADRQQVAMEIAVDAGVSVSVDHDRMVRVFLNLMHNALDAMPEGGVIRVTNTCEASAVVIHVEDTGPGISEDLWPKLFQPFASFGKRNGLGLGLALSRQTVLEHEGDLWAERGKTRGASFHVRLPLRNK